jgi:hypothetical protein
MPHLPQLDHRNSNEMFPNFSILSSKVVACDLLNYYFFQLLWGKVFLEENGEAKLLAKIYKYIFKRSSPRSATFLIYILPKR